MTTGTPGNDKLINHPNVNPETVDGLGGDDVIQAQRPNAGMFDSALVAVDGGEGFDRLFTGGRITGATSNASSGSIFFTYTGNDGFIDWEVRYTGIERLTMSGQTLATSNRIDFGNEEDFLDLNPGTNGMNAEIFTGGGNDTVRLAPANNFNFGQVILNTGAGDDTIRLFDFVTGTAIVAGGAGNDIYEIGNNVVVTENANEGIDEVRTYRATYTLPANVENLTGTVGNHSFTGNDLANTIVVGAGTNSLAGLGGDDILAGGIGMDMFDGGEGSDTLDYSRYANDGNVIVNLTSGDVPSSGRTSVGPFVSANTAYDGAGNRETLTSIENVKTRGGQDFIYGSEGANRIETGALNDYIEGRGGDDYIDGGTGGDNMIGGAGNDVYIVDNAGDIVDEQPGGGTDEVRTSLSSYTAPANVEKVTFTSNGGGTITGNDQNNTLVGGSGNDTIDGRGGADVMIGGQGDDVYFVDNPNDQVLENPNEGTDEIRTGLSTYSLETLPNVENLTGIGLGPQTLIGNAGANRITSGAGIDTLAGGAGNDVYVVNDEGDRVQENGGLSGGDDEVRTALASYSLAGRGSVERLVGTSASGQTLTGNDEANVIDGGAGNDTLIGNGGDDILRGNGGDDILIGLAGADLLQGGAGNDIYAIDAADTVDEKFDGGTDEVRTVGSIFTLQANVENLRGQNDGGHLFRGNAGPNGLVGANGNDLILAQDGGDDVLFGLGGDDQFYFGNAFDRYDFVRGGEGTDRLILQGNYSAGLLFGDQIAGNILDVERIELLSSSNTAYGGQSAGPNNYALTMRDSNVQPGQAITIDASGLAANETLSLDATGETSSTYIVLGGGGNDAIATGGAGDRITGGGGADSINGGGGADVFGYTAVSDSTPTAMDNLVTFTSGTDKIDVSLIDAISGTPSNDAFTFIGSNAFTAAGQLRTVDIGGGIWQVQGDVDGDGIADLVIQLNTGGAGPLATDFVL